MTERNEKCMRVGSMQRENSRSRIMFIKYVLINRKFPFFFRMMQKSRTVIAWLFYRCGIAQNFDYSFKSFPLNDRILIQCAVILPRENLFRLYSVKKKKNCNAFFLGGRYFVQHILCWIAESNFLLEAFEYYEFCNNSERVSASYFQWK